VARVLVADRVSRVLLEILEGSGISVDYHPNIGGGELERLAPLYDAIVVRGGRLVSRRVLESGVRGRLRVVARAGVGLDNIDVEAARALGVKVINAPEASTQSVAELTVGLMIAAARRIAELDGKVKRGEWERPLGIELYGKNLFIVGFGRIGRRVAEIARCIGMRVYAYDVADVEEEARKREVRLVGSLKEGLMVADVVSLHVPLTKETLYLINRETLRWLKRGAILVNTSRGRVVDPEALLWALDEGIVAAAALDVHEYEPPRGASLSLARHPRVIATPHIGAQTVEAQERIAREIAVKLLKELRGLEGAAGQLPRRRSLTR